MHHEARAYIAQWVKGRRFDHVLEFGSLDINGSVRVVIQADEYWGVDLQSGPGVDEVADAVGYLRLTTNEAGDAYLVKANADLVVCCETLEHAPDVPGVVRSAFENSRSGGVFLVTCATDPRKPHSAVDGGPIRPGEHYENVDPETLVGECEAAGFIVQDWSAHRGRGDLYLRGKKP